MQTQTFTSSLRRAFIALAVALLALTVIAPLEAQQTAIDGRLLPLGVDTFSVAEGYRLDQRVYYLPPAPHGAQAVGVRVTGSARVGDRDAWVVAATTPGGGTTYWIDKATRTVLKYDTREGPAVIEFRR